MATAGIVIKGDFPELDAVREKLTALGDKRTNAVILNEALKKAIKPALDRLKQITPVGPTGNLKRAASSKTKAYPKDGVAVGLIGYQKSQREAGTSAQGGSVRAGKTRGFHQWWIEFGTQPRTITTFSNKPYGRRGHTRRIPGKSAVDVRPHMVQGQNLYIASSYNTLGPFRTYRQLDGRVQTDPQYPNAFFKASKTPVTLPPTPAGGVARVPPVQTAFRETQGQVAAILTRELQLSYEKVVNTLTLRGQGTITGV